MFYLSLNNIFYSFSDLTMSVSMPAFHLRSANRMVDVCETASCLYASMIMTRLISVNVFTGRYAVSYNH